VGGVPGQGGSAGQSPGGAGASAGAAGQAGAAGACAYENDAQFCSCLGKSCGGDTVKDKAGQFHAVYCGGCASDGSYCAAFATEYGGALGTCSAGGGLDPVQKQKAEMMTSIWENSTTKLQYGYSQDIGDGRGYTSGRAGFCTGTGDGILVIECYDLAKPGNAMQTFMPALVSINEKFAASGGTAIQSSEVGLDGFPAAWKSTSAADPAFNACQDSVVNAVYYGTALRHAAEHQFSTALTKAAFYDAQINQGEADPRFGMIYMIAQADKLTGPLGAPPTLDDESKWLKNFLVVRDGIMKQYPEWAGNRYRVSTYEKLRAAGNWDLSACIVTDEDVFTIVTSGGMAKATAGSSCP